MKRIILLALCLMICLGQASAHSGKTDGQGGHYNHATGEYHYHHGYPAHQHTNGICPYNFEDRSGESSGTGGGGGQTDGIEASINGGNAAQGKDTDPDWVAYGFLAFCGYVMLRFLFDRPTYQRSKKPPGKMIEYIKALGLVLLLFSALPIATIGYALMKWDIIPFSAGGVVAFSALAANAVSAIFFYFYSKKK